jgi:hypothetical protein
MTERGNTEARRHCGLNTMLRTVIEGSGFHTVMCLSLDRGPSTEILT